MGKLDQTKLISVDRVFTRLNRLGVPTDNESDIIEWIGQALEEIGAIPQYEEAVAFIVVENFTCQLPANFHSITQIAKNNLYSAGLQASACTCEDVINNAEEDEEEGPSIPVAINAQGEPENAYDLAYYRPFFDLKYGYNGWSNSPLYKRAFTPVHLKTNNFFGTTVTQNPNFASPIDEYSVVAGTTLKFSFQCGQIALAFRRQPLDCNNRPYIPDEPSFLKAIENYVATSHFTREFISGKEGSKERLDYFEVQWIWYCGQASNAAMMLYGEDEYQNFLQQRSSLIPNRNAYFNFFGRQFTNRRAN